MRLKLNTKNIFITLIIAMMFFPGQGLATQASASKTIQDKTDIKKPLLPYVLTLARAKQFALKTSPTLSSVKERIFQARESVKQVRAEYLPTLSLKSSRNYTDKAAVSGTGDNEDLYSNRISATQILFDGFERKYALISAKSGESQAIEAVKEAERLLVWSVASAYLKVQQSIENIQIAQSDMEYNQELAKEATIKENAGTGSLSDVLNFETNANLARSSIINAEQDYKESIHALAALMGYDDSRLPRGMKPAGLGINLIPDHYLPDIDLEMENILEKRPDLKQTRYAIQDAQAGINEEKSGFFPIISLTGSYGATSVERFEDLGDTDYMDASIGININFDIFSGGATKSRVRQAKSKKRELEKNLEQARIDARSDILSAFDKIISTKKQVLLRRRNANLTEKARDLVEKEYRVGQKSLVRLTQAQNDLVAARGSLASARVSLILAKETFDYYTGQNMDSITPDS